MNRIYYTLLHPESKEPYQKYKTDACFDIYATSIEDLGDGRILYGTGLSLNLPIGTRLDLRSRSSIHKTGLLLSNSIGTIDETYTGEIKAVFYNVLKELPNYKVGDRIAQVHLEQVSTVCFIEKEEIRGSNGYGSTGNN